MERYEIIHAHYNAVDNLDAGVKWAGSHLGTRYDYKNLFIFAWKTLKYKLGIRWKRHNKSTESAMHCSKATTRFLQEAGYLTDLPADSVSPLEFRSRLDTETDFIDVTDEVKSGEWWRKTISQE